MPRKSYVLATRAAADLREARVWSRARWGKDLTNRYLRTCTRGRNTSQRTTRLSATAKHSLEARRFCCIRFASTTLSTRLLDLDSLPYWWSFGKDVTLPQSCRNGLRLFAGN